MSEELQQRARVEVDQTLKAAGFTFGGLVQGVPVYEGAVTSGSRRVGLQLHVVDTLFTRAPEVFITDAEVRDEIQAHINVDGTFCYTDRGLEEYDLYNAGGAVLRCLESIRDTLNQVLHSNPQADLEREFLSYWQAGSFQYADLPASFSGAARSYEWLRGDQRGILTTTPNRAAKWRHQLRGDGSPAHVTQATRPLVARRGQLPGFTLASFRCWVSPFVEANDIERTLSARSVDGGEVIVVAGNGTISVSFHWPSIEALAFKKATRERRHRWITAHEGQMTMQRTEVRNIDLDSIVNARLAAPSPLIGRSVAVVGAGAVGSRVILDLVRSGAGSPGTPMLVIDPDRLVSVNLGRHVLGTDDLGKFKAEAIADAAKRVHPAVEVIPLAADVFDCLARLGRYDVLIDASGSNPLALRLNEIAVSERAAGRRFPVVIHASVHGNGAAVQTVLVDGPGHACFKCLRPGHGEFKVNPLKPGVLIDSVPAACGDGAFVPYAATAPAMAAALAVQAALEWASDPQNPGPRVRTRVLDADRTSPQKDKSHGIDAACPACQHPSDAD